MHPAVCDYVKALRLQNDMSWYDDRGQLQSSRISVESVYAEPC